MLFVGRRKHSFPLGRLDPISPRNLPAPLLTSTSHTKQHPKFFMILILPFPGHFCGLNFLRAFAHWCQLEMTSSSFLPPTFNLTTGSS